MNILKSFGIVIVILILRGLLTLRGKKTIPIKWYDESAIDIPIKWR